MFILCFLLIMFGFLLLHCFIQLFSISFSALAHSLIVIFFCLSSSCCSFMSFSVCVCLAFKLDRVKMKHLFSVAKQIIVPGRFSMHLSIIIKFFNRYLFLFFVVICNICTIFGNFVVAF